MLKSLGQLQDVHVLVVSSQGSTSVAQTLDWQCRVSPMSSQVRQFKVNGEEVKMLVANFPYLLP